MVRGTWHCIFCLSTAHRQNTHPFEFLGDKDSRQNCRKTSKLALTGILGISVRQLPTNCPKITICGWEAYLVLGTFPRSNYTVILLSPEFSTVKIKNLGITCLLISFSSIFPIAKLTIEYSSLPVCRLGADSTTTILSPRSGFYNYCSTFLLAPGEGWGIHRDQKKCLT